MAITYVSSTEQLTSSDASPLTFTFDIGTRTNGLLVVNVHITNNLSVTLSSPTWNSVAMSSAVLKNRDYSGLGTAYHIIEQFYLVNPTNGNQTFSVNHSGIVGVASCYITALWADGALQTQGSILDNTTSGNGATDISLSLTPNVNNTILVAAYLHESNNPLTKGAGETEVQNQDQGPRQGGLAYAIQTAAGAQDFDWTGDDDQWDAVIASYKEAAGAATAVKDMLSEGIIPFPR